MDFGGDEFHALKPIAESHFHIAVFPGANISTCTFIAGIAGKPAIYESVQTVDPVPAQLGEYAGSYASKEVDPVWSPDGRYLYFASDRGGSMNL